MKKEDRFDCQKKFLDALESWEKRCYGLAWEELQEVLEHDPKHGRAHTLIGAILFQKTGDPVLAEQHFRMALRYAPEYEDLYFHYGLLLAGQNRAGELRRLCRQGFRFSVSAKASLYFVLGKNAELNENFREAATQYQQAVQLGSRREELAEYRAALERVQEFQKRKRKRFLFFYAR